jgi:hypothetical protein
MPDNWAFVAAAYGLTALVLGLYWRHLVRKEHELRRTTPAHSKTADSKTVDSTTADAKTSGSERRAAGTEREVAGAERPVAGTARAHMERPQQASTAPHPIAERSRQPSGPAHPRPDPTPRHPLQ